jgi:hypothetical protein
VRSSSLSGRYTNFGNADLVFDKFRVIQEANEGVEAVRRLEITVAKPVMANVTIAVIVVGC